MNRLVLSGVGGLVALGVAGAILYPTPASQAQQKQPPEVRQETKPVETRTSSLPLTQAVLYTNGVGYFEREGTVQGDAEVELTCRLGEVNDLLKSLMVQDMDRGKPGAVTLAGPVEQHRSSNSLEGFMENNPSWQDILLLARGTSVEVTLEPASPVAAAPAPVTGVLISIENPLQQHRVANNLEYLLSPQGQPMPNAPPGGGLGRLSQAATTLPARYLPDDDAQTIQLKVKNEARPEPTRLQLLTSQGQVTIRLDQVKRVKLLDQQLDQSIRAALAKVPRPFQALGNQPTTVRLRLEGAGQRRVRVSYLREQPMWKTSYRLMLDDKGTAQLQGWAIVENPSDEDWNRIQLKLVAGQPVSFRMDLHTSLQPRRPEASVPSYKPFLPKGHAALFDRHSGPVALLPNMGGETTLDQKPAEKQGGGLGGPGGLGGGGLGGGGLGGGGLGGGGLGGVASGGARAPSGMGGLGGGMPENEQPPPGAPVGSYFEYTIAEPVTLAHGKTSMVPLLQTAMPAERLSLYQFEKNNHKALLALRLLNDTKLLLGAGPVTIIDRRQLAGEAQLPEVAVGAKTFLTYGVDASLQVTEKSIGKNQSAGIEIRYSTLDGFKEKLVEQYTSIYQFTNRDAMLRRVLIEQPRTDNSKLIKPKESKESDDNTYRFQTEVAPGQRGEYTVVVNQHHDWSSSPPPQDLVKPGTIQKSNDIEGVGSIEVVMEDQPERPGVVTSAAGYLFLTNHLERRYRYSLNAVEGREWSGTLRHGIDHSWNVSRPPEGAKLDDRELVIPIKALPNKPTILDVMQDKAVDKKILLSQASASELGAILRDRQIPPALKPVLEQAMNLQSTLTSISNQQTAIKARLQEIDVEQNRLRANMKDLPKDVPLYKRYLEKFDKQEQEIDERRDEAKKLREQEADLLKKLKDLEQGLK
ncbi:MAG TPA: DUF4139 domain-containing protein [Gemmatales bacterium]|nr:DUF4139 domain-containing protein [Gemmatales bacterium]